MPLKMNIQTFPLVLTLLTTLLTVQFRGEVNDTLRLERNDTIQVYFDKITWNYSEKIAASTSSGNYRNAAVYQQKLMAIQDSLREVEKTKAIRHFQKEFELALSEDEIALANARNASQEARIKQQNLQRYIYLAGGISLFVLVVGMLSRLNYMRRTRIALEHQSKQIFQEKKRAEESEKVREEFLAKMSHEIRSPMNAVVGMTNILKKNRHYAAQERYLDAISQSSDSLLIILNDILDLSKIEDGTIKMEHLPFRPIDELMKLREILKYKAEEKGVELRCELDKEIPEVLIGDPVRLNQILINLTGNAIKFTKEGNVFVTVQLKKSEKQKVYLETRVTDTGIGISPDRLEQIFESFTQAESTTTREYGGTGLGLTISKELIEIQQGNISVESEEGKGSTFTFEIPFDVGSPELLQDDKHDAVPASLEGLNVLLVEDNEFNIMVATDELKEIIRDVKISLANNGKEAVKMVMEQDFDLILMDIEMKEMNGYEAAEAIRGLESPKNEVPIIAVTANAIRAEIEKCFESGMDAHLSKPLDTSKLKEKIVELVHTGS
jgi:signal transduction histidine kinase/CheY-like chemotaxis protein